MKTKEVLFWSIALPGFGQLLNKKYFKGIIFIFLEFLININSHFNEAITLSFNGEIKKAIDITDYQWLLFYPCIYFFAMWDAYRDAGGGSTAYSFSPFVFSAYFVTLGTMYSSKVDLLGVVWLPILCVIPGLIVGFLLKKVLTKKGSQ